MSGRIGSVAGAVAQRQLMAVNPAHVVPPLILPLIFFAAFAGGLSQLGEIPEFGYPDYTSFIFVFVLFMGSSFVGVFRGIALATDLETGFARRMIAAAPRPVSLVLGYVFVALMQSLLV